MQTNPTFTDIEAAAERIKPYAAVTPVITSSDLNAKLNTQCFIKAEMLQRTGTFKFRGAFNRLSQLSKVERKNGVVAFSSGNHAQGVAAAAQILGISATIVMPRDAPALKIHNTRSYGANVVLYDRYNEDRVAIGNAIADKTGAILVPPYDDPHIIAGQGTMAREFILQLREQNISLDILLCCCGGGGLMAGTALSFEALSPATLLYSVEPEHFDDTARSLKSGERQRNEAGAHSICDALLTEMPGALTFPINNRLLAGGLRVTDNQVKDAIYFASTTFKLTVEPGGAVALAAALSKKLDFTGKKVGIICSGGNIEPALLAECLTRNIDNPK